MSKVLNTNSAPEGLVVGTPASEQVLPPEPLTPMDFKYGGYEGKLDEIDQIKYGAAGIIAELEEAGIRVPSKDQDRNVRWASWRVIDAGGDPTVYARYVIGKFKAKYGRRPLWQQIIGEKAVNNWLPEYTRGQAQAADRVSYEATPERRAEYAERMKQDQLP